MWEDAVVCTVQSCHCRPTTVCRHSQINCAAVSPPHCPSTHSLIPLILCHVLAPLCGICAERMQAGAGLGRTHPEVRSMLHPARRRFASVLFALLSGQFCYCLLTAMSNLTKPESKRSTWSSEAVSSFEKNQERICLRGWLATVTWFMGQMFAVNHNEFDF